MTALLAQLVMAGVDIGQKHHQHTAMITYRRILVNLLHSDTRQSFWDDIPNLQHPSGWRLIFDSITLANGSTEMVMIVVYTTRQGELRKQLFDLKNCGKDYSGPQEAALVLQALSERLGIPARQARCTSTPALPLDDANRTLVHRGNFLTCIPCDRAYCGKTGTRADDLIGTAMGIHSILGGKRRIGMADLFHCYDSSIKKYWPQGKTKDKKKEVVDVEDAAVADNVDSDSDTTSLTSSSSSSSSSSDSEHHDDLLRTEATKREAFSQSLGQWTDQIIQVRHMLHRGQGRRHLAEAYARHGYHGCPGIQRPSKTRMIAYARSYLQQSFTHHVVRYDALLHFQQTCEQRAEQEHGPARTRLQKRALQVTACGELLANASALFPALLLHSCLDHKEGFFAGALQIQSTDQIFFPLHVVSTRVWWNLRQLSAYPNAFLKEKQILHKRANPAPAMVPGLRCPGCGLLKRRNQLLHHVRDCHMKRNGRDLLVPEMEQQFLNPVHVVRPANCFDPEPEDTPSMVLPSLETFEGLALSLCGNIPSLLGVAGIVRMLVTLAGFVTMPCEMPIDTDHQNSSYPGCLLHTWHCFFIAALSSAGVLVYYRLMPTFFRSVPSYCFAGQWLNSGCSIEGFGRILSIRDTAMLRRSALVRRAGACVLAHVEGCRALIHIACANFKTQVLESHGVHISKKVRDASTLVFWLPRILTDPRLHMPATNDVKQFWKPLLVGIDLLLGYIAAQLDMFTWPPSAVVQQQYMSVMRVWSKLLERPDIRAQVLPNNTFDWLQWWKLVHTDARFAPPCAVPIVHMFHYAGMIGVSEAYAEAIGSWLTMFGCNKSKNRTLTSTIRDRVFMKSHNLKGDGTDDMLLMRTWAEYFGSCKPEVFTFIFKRYKRRATRYAEGKGSSTINNYFEKRKTGNWNRARVGKLARLGIIHGPGGTKRVLRTHVWNKKLKQRTEA